MIFFKKTKQAKNNFSALGVDMHSHLIPGVDDGAESVASSVELINGLHDLGFEKLCTTPHSMQGIHPNTKDSLTAGLSRLQGTLSDQMLPLLSSEYYLDDHFSKLIEDDQLLPLPGNRILLEFSQINRPFGLEDTLFKLALKGYQIILAHPERYLFFHKNFNDFIRLKDMGLEFQVNALSLSNHYGRNVRTMAEKLIAHKLIDFIGTDTHRKEHLALLKEIPDTKCYKTLIDSGLIKNRALID